MSDMFVRVQEKGQVSIPSHIRRKLKLKKGDLVVFIETESGVVIKPAEVITADAFAEIGQALLAKDVSLDQLIERGRALRASLIADEYRLNEPVEK